MTNTHAEHKPLKARTLTRAAKTPIDIRSLCRAWTKTAVKTLGCIMVSPDVPPSARVHAAEVLLDRGWGKPPQFSTANAEQFMRLMDLTDAELTARLEAVGVRPMHDVTPAAVQIDQDKDKPE